MTAANRRFEARRVAGLPLLTVVGAVSTLTALVLALMLPGLARALFLLVAVVGLGAVWIGIRYHEDLIFIGILLRFPQERDYPLVAGWVRR